MKKIIKYAIGLGTTLLLLPFIAFATPSSVDRITDHIEPLIKSDYIKSVYFIGTSTTASSTFANGLNVTGGCFAYGGVCIGNISGSGTANQLAYWSSGTGLTSSSVLTRTANGLLVASPTDNGAIVLSARGESGAGSGISVTDGGVSTLHLSSLIFSNDNLYDIGALNATRPRDVHVARNIEVGNSLTAVGTVSAADVTATNMLTTGLIASGNASALKFTATGNAASVFPYASTTMITATTASTTDLIVSSLSTANGAVYTPTGGRLTTEAGYTYNESTNLLTVPNLAVTNTGASSFVVGNSTTGVINVGDMSLTSTGGTALNNIVIPNANALRFFTTNDTFFQYFGRSYSASAQRADFYFDYSYANSTDGDANFRNLRNSETVLQLNNGGNVGIGTTTITAKFHVSTSTSGTMDVFKSVGGQVNNQAGTFVQTGLGNTVCAGCVGIGTTSPYAKLSVNGRGIFNQDVRADYFTATGTVASTFPYASTTALSVSGTAYFPGTGIWNSSGNVGIGTTNPLSQLSLAGYGAISGVTGNNTGYLTHQYGASDGLDYLSLAGNFRRTDSNAGTIFTNSQATAEVLIGTQSNDGRIMFNTTASNNVVPTERVRITASGKVGVATSTPTSIFSVTGTSTLAGDIDLLSTGSSPVVGNATLASGTVTVATGAATTNSFIMLTRKSTGGTIGTAITYTVTNGSFTITSDSLVDTSTFTWLIIN